MSEQFGVPNYSGKQKTEKAKRANPHRLGSKNPVEVGRIIPPIKSGISTGTWIRYAIVHWGYQATLQKDPDKTYRVSFLCPKTFSKTAQCAQCEKIERKTKALNDLVDQCRATNKSESETNTLTAPLKAWVDEYNSKGGYYLNFMNQAGEFYPLILNGTTKATLDRLIDKLVGPDKSKPKTKPLDPTDGFWFRFEYNDNGKGNTVEVVQDIVDYNGTEVYVNKKAPLTESQQVSAVANCTDIAAADVARVLPPGKIEMLANCSGDPAEVMNIVDAAELAGTTGNTITAAPKTTTPDTEKTPENENEFFEQFRDS